MGSPLPRISWLKGDEPLQLTERYHFTPGNQLLIIRNAVQEDAGKYTCVMSNTLGTERAHSQLSVQQASGCVVSRKDGTMTVGIIIIAVVCSIVITSLVWVCIIYQTRKKSEEYSVTNTGGGLCYSFRFPISQVKITRTSVLKFRKEELHTCVSTNI